MAKRGMAARAAGRIDRRALVSGAVAAALAIVAPSARRAGARQAAPTILAADWVEADRVGLPLYNTADGATPPPIAFQADFPFGAIAAHWSGDAPSGAWVEAWFSADGDTWSDAVSVGEDPDNGRPGRDGRRFGPLIAAPAGAQFVRYYTYDASGALTTLDGFTWTTIDASAGPAS
ncbi:MAG TPA: hypothetical protein VFI22_16980, partial [Thermomicrobiales bacterium]|nr:hypothetical protein [Thermomicrobiales bacterium]